MINLVEEKDLIEIKSMLNDIQKIVDNLKNRMAWVESSLNGKQDKVDLYQPFMPYPNTNPVPSPMRPWCSGGVPDPNPLV